MSKRDKQLQSHKFIEAAKELECDEDEKAFNEKLKKIVPNSTESKD